MRLIKQAHKLPREVYKSLTWDRGKEMADHQRFSLDTNIKVYFSDPQSPWQREVPTKTPTAFCDNTSRREWISQTFIKTN